MSNRKWATKEEKRLWVSLSRNPDRTLSRRWSARSFLPTLHNRTVPRSKTHLPWPTVPLRKNTVSRWNIVTTTTRTTHFTGTVKDSWPVNTRRTTCLWIYRRRQGRTWNTMDWQRRTDIRLISTWVRLSSRWIILFWLHWCRMRAGSILCIMELTQWLLRRNR